MISFTRKDFLKSKIRTLISAKQYESIKKKIHNKNLTFDKVLLDISILLWKRIQEQKGEEKVLGAKSISPYIIGINGSISVGKSRFTKDLKKLLLCFPDIKHISILSTDNFIYPNNILKKKNIFSQKGFPISYNWKQIFNVLKKIKTKSNFSIPIYDQKISDINKNHKQTIKFPQDVIIIEGINLLKPNCEKNFDQILLSDYLDFTIFLNASSTLLHKWFNKRLLDKKKTWKAKKIKKKFTRKSKKEFKQFSDNIWKNINLRNLKEHILPYKYRSNIVIEKGLNHKIKNIEIIDL